MYGGHWFGGGFMWIFWIALFLLVVWVVQGSVRKGGDSSKDQKSAIDILKERYARGEIDQEEFEQRRKDLED